MEGEEGGFGNISWWRWIGVLNPRPRRFAKYDLRYLIVAEILARVRRNPKDDKLIEAFDQINRQQGPGAINFGTAGQNSVWRSHSDHRSPRYTTEWDGIPVVKT